MSKRTSSLFGLALNVADDAKAPDWVQLTPAGPKIIGRDGRWWQLTDPQAVADRFDPTKEPQIDIEHSSQMQAPNGLPAPAVGWIKGLEVRDGALWGRVEWTSVGATLVGDRAYRYLSPVFTFDFGSGEIQRIVCAGLTNTPSRDYHLAVCRAQDGLAKFKTFAEAAPVIAAPSKLGAEPPAGQQGKPSSEELAVCRLMGMTPEDFAAARAAEKKE